MRRAVVEKSRVVKFICTRILGARVANFLWAFVTIFVRRLEVGDIVFIPKSMNWLSKARSKSPAHVLTTGSSRGARVYTR